MRFVQSNDMKRRIKPFEIAMLLLPILLLIGVALMSGGGRSTGSRRSGALNFLIEVLSFQRPHDYISLFLVLQVYSSVIIVVVLFLQFMIDQVPPPFDSEKKKKPQPPAT